MKIELSENINDEGCILTEFPEDGMFSGTESSEGEFKIFIKKKTLNEIDDFLSSDLQNELGGLIVGDLCRNSSGEKFIKIDGFIIAKHTHSSASRLTFTHDTWEQMNSEAESRHPGKKILGWHHSHPGHTVFFSNFDNFIQENFFNMDYMVAYVFDPTIRERAFFYRKENNTLKASGFYVYGNFEPGQRIDRDNGDLLSDTLNPKETKKLSFKEKLLKYFPAALTFVNLVFLVFFAFGIYSIYDRTDTLDNIEAELEILKRDNEDLKGKLNDLKLNNDLKNYSGNTDIIGSMTDKASDNLSGNVENKFEKNSGHDVEKTNSGSSIQYTVKPGDTIEKIILMHNISRDKMNDIMALNNLKRSNELKIGQVINLPGK